MVPVSLDWCYNAMPGDMLQCRTHDRLCIYLQIPKKRIKNK